VLVICSLQAFSELGVPRARRHGDEVQEECGRINKDGVRIQNSES
jgi:hypothetical protein